MPVYAGNKISVQKPIIEVSFAFLQALSVQIIKTLHKLPDN